jgi:uncharacterized integral membrane protein
MVKLIRLILALVGIVVVIALAIANRAPTTVSFYPLPFSFTLPLYGVALICLVGGVVLGGLATWFGASRRRGDARRARRRVRAYEADAAERRRQDERAEEEQRRDRRESLALAAPAP